LKKWSGQDSSIVHNNKIVISNNTKITDNFFRYKAGGWVDYYSDKNLFVEFNFNNDMFTDVGSSILYNNTPCCFIVYLYFGTLKVTKAFIGDIEVEQDGSFMFMNQNGSLLVNGKFTSSEYCEGSISSTIPFAFYSFKAKPRI
jgi:hypothetical protein